MNGGPWARVNEDTEEHVPDWARGLNVEIRVHEEKSWVLKAFGEQFSSIERTRHFWVCTALYQQSDVEMDVT